MAPEGTGDCLILSPAVVFFSAQNLSIFLPKRHDLVTRQAGSNNRWMRENSRLFIGWNFSCRVIEFLHSREVMHPLKLKKI
jgi:hypothetical protein